MTWLIDPKTRQMLPRLSATLRSGHPASRWVPEYEDGVPVRMYWQECHCPVHQPAIDAANEAIRAQDERNRSR